MAIRESDRVTFCMHYCHYSCAMMNENCILYPLHCLSGLTESQDQQLVCNASFKGWAVQGSYYAISIVCHSNIACSKKYCLSPSFSSFIFDHCSPPPSSSAGVMRGQSQLICVYHVRGGWEAGISWQLITGHEREKKIYNYSTICRKEQTLLIPIGIFFVGFRNEYSR